MVYVRIVYDKAVLLAKGNKHSALAISIDESAIIRVEGNFLTITIKDITHELHFVAIEKLFITLEAIVWSIQNDTPHPLLKPTTNQN